MANKTSLSTDTTHAASLVSKASESVVGLWGGVFGVLFLVAVAFSVSMSKLSSRTWLINSRTLLLAVGIIALATFLAAAVRGWLHGRSTTLCATVFLLIND
jgi:hypothetical protein